MFAGLIRLIWYGFLAYLVFAVIRFLFRAGQKTRPRPAAKSGREPGVMVKDEVCNTYLPREDALREVQGGREFFFCSRACRQKFLDRAKAGDQPASPAS
jgi:uncharacterized protein